MSNHSDFIPDYLNDPVYMETVLKNDINGKFAIKNIEVSPGSSFGDNYICQIFRINVTVERGNKVEQISIIGKFNPETKMFEEMVNEGMNVHTTECKFLFTVLPILEKLHSGPKIGPKCHYSDDKRNIFFMEDLKKQGFCLVPRNKFLDLDHCLKTIRAEATFHATSYLQIKKDPSLKEKFSVNLWRRQLPEFFQKFVDNSFNSIEKNYDTWQMPQSYRDMLKKLKNKVDTEGFGVCEFDERNFNILTHCDCWKNNMMFKYKDDQVEECCLLDFQLVNYNCFALDLQYFLSSSSTQEVRYEMIDKVLEYYYDCFCKVAPNVPELTLERVKKEFKDKEFLGFLMAVLMRPMVVCEDGLDIDKILEGGSDGAMFGTRSSCDELIAALNYFAPLVEL